MIRDKLLALRSEKKLSQTDVAKLLNVTRQAYNHYETGVRIPPTEAIIIFSEIYDVSIDYLLERTEQKKISSPSKEDELISKLDEESLSKLEELLQMVDVLSDENFQKLMDYARLVGADQQKHEAK